MKQCQLQLHLLDTVHPPWESLDPPKGLCTLKALITCRAQDHLQLEARLELLDLIDEIWVPSVAQELEDLKRLLQKLLLQSLQPTKMATHETTHHSDMQLAGDKA